MTIEQEIQIRERELTANLPYLLDDNIEPYNEPQRPVCCVCGAEIDELNYCWKCGTIAV